MLHKVHFRAFCLLAALLTTGYALGNMDDSADAKKLVRETVENEIHQSNGRLRFRYLDQKKAGQSTQTKAVIETHDLTVGLLIALNGRPLTQAQRQQEHGRLENLARNPNELNRKRKAEKEDEEHTDRIMRALPDAFIFTHAGTEPGREGLGTPGGELVRLNFCPNPNYSPPTHVEQVLTGMQGYVLIDENRHRIAKIDATLIREVAFGWGILGHLDRGGHFLVEQADVGQGAWEVTRMDLDLHGKALLFKAINISSSETYRNFTPAPPDLTVAQAVQLLERQQSQLAENYLPQRPK